MSSQVTARQLQRSVEEGLEGEQDGFEAVQRQLLAAVQRASARESAVSSGAAVQETLRKLFPNSYMCGKCGFGPVDHVACTDLRSHHGEKRGGAQISNACPKCAWFSPQVTDWPLWDGRVWHEQNGNEEMGASSSAGPALKRRRRDSSLKD